MGTVPVLGLVQPSSRLAMRPPDANGRLCRGVHAVSLAGTAPVPDLCYAFQTPLLTARMKRHLAQSSAKKYQDAHGISPHGPSAPTRVERECLLAQFLVRLASMSTAQACDQTLARRALTPVDAVGIWASGGIAAAAVEMGSSIAPLNVKQVVQQTARRQDQHWREAAEKVLGATGSRQSGAPAMFLVVQGIEIEQFLVPPEQIRIVSRAAP